jgi:hypothetical protein
MSHFINFVLLYCVVLKFDLQAPVLFKDPERYLTIIDELHWCPSCYLFFRLEDAITALKNIFLQQRPSANSLFLCQVSLITPLPHPLELFTPSGLFYSL